MSSNALLFDSDEDAPPTNKQQQPQQSKPASSPASKGPPKFKAPPGFVPPAQQQQQQQTLPTSSSQQSLPNSDAGAASVSSAPQQEQQQQTQNQNPTTVLVPQPQFASMDDDTNTDVNSVAPSENTMNNNNNNNNVSQHQQQQNNNNNNSAPSSVYSNPMEINPHVIAKYSAPEKRPTNLPLAQWDDQTDPQSTLFRVEDPHQPPNQYPRSSSSSSSQQQQQQQQNNNTATNQQQQQQQNHQASPSFPPPSFTTDIAYPQPPNVPSPVVVAPDPPASLNLPPKNHAPVTDMTSDTIISQQNAAAQPAWEAFAELRRQLDESHARLLAVHGEISRSQVHHEDEANAYKQAVENQLSTQKKELETLNDKYNEVSARLDIVNGVVMRKTEEIMKLEQKLHDAAVQRASVLQHSAIVEDKAKLAAKAKMAAEVRASELELSLEHTQSLLMSLRKQLNSANEEKNEALQKQYKLFEENRQQVIQFYADRERYVLGAFNDSIQKSHSQLAERERAREQQVIAHWSNVSRSQIDELKSLVEENKKRADGHAKEIIDLKEKQDEEKNKWLLHLQNEIKLADQRAAEREKNLVADLTKREREMSEREQKMRVQFAQAEQDAKLQLIQREAELKATYDKLLEDLRNAYDTDREKTVTGFREQLASIASQHLHNERELEKMHREKEKEMGQRYRIAGYDAEDQRQRSEMESVTSKTTGTLLAKFEQYELREKERADAGRVRMTVDGKPKPESAGTSSLAPPSGLSASSTTTKPKTSKLSEFVPPSRVLDDPKPQLSARSTASSVAKPAEKK